MITTTDHAHLLAALDTGDDGAILPLADALEEAGDRRATGLRLAATCPKPVMAYCWGDGPRHGWWAPWTGYAPALPKRVFAAMTDGDRDHPSAVHYLTRSLAYFHLAEAMIAPPVVELEGGKPRLWPAGSSPPSPPPGWGTTYLRAGGAFATPDGDITGVWHTVPASHTLRISVHAQGCGSQEPGHGPLYEVREFGPGTRFVVVRRGSAERTWLTRIVPVKE